MKPSDENLNRDELGTLYAIARDLNSTLDLDTVLQLVMDRLVEFEEAQSKDDLRLLPSNHFEALIGDRQGQCSIRINQHWRLCFAWSEGENRAVQIEVVDYH